MGSDIERREEFKSVQATLYRTATGSIDVRTLDRVRVRLISKAVNRQKEKHKEHGSHRIIGKSKHLAYDMIGGGTREGGNSQATE